MAAPRAAAAPAPYSAAFSASSSALFAIVGWVVPAGASPTLELAAVFSILTGVGSVLAGASALGTAAVAIDFSVTGAVVLVVPAAPRGADVVPAAWLPAIAATPPTAAPDAAAGAAEDRRVSGLVDFAASVDVAPAPVEVVAAVSLAGAV